MGGFTMTGFARAIFAALCAFVCASVPSPLFADAPALDNYTHLPNAELAAISPDGRKIAMVQGAGGDNRMIAFYPLDGSKPSRIDIGPMKARGLTWASDEHVIVWASVTKDYGVGTGRTTGYTVEFVRVMSIHEPTGNVEWLFSKDVKFSLMVGAPRLLHTLPDDPDNILMSYWDPYSGVNRGAKGGSRLGGKTLGDEFALTVYRANLNDGTVDKIEGGNEHTSYFVADAKGNLRFRVDYVDTHDRREIYYRGADERRFAKIAEFAEDDGEESDYYVEGLDPAGVRAFADTRGDGGRFRLHEYAVSGALGPSVFSDPVYDIDGPILDPHTQAVIGVEITRDLPEQHFFDEDLAGVLSSLKSVFKDGRGVLIDSYSLDRSMIVVRTMKPGAPSEFYLFDTNGKELSFLASNYPTIAPEALGKIERYDHRASDGLDIPGYLITPAGKPKSKLPLVVLPHGGPWARDSMSFDWEAQYYAAMGYAVYKPNFRGSEGYGLNYRVAGYKQWGLKMQDDITEGVQKLIADGVADPARICIVGGSYGGYAALMGGAKTPELYKCVAAWGPVTDIPGIFAYDKTITGRSSEQVVFMRASVGEDRDELNAVSPVKLAANFAAPVLLIHGKDDTVVPIRQSRDMAMALESAGKSVELLEFSGEDHWLSTYSTRRQMLDATSAFLREHLGE
jgi:acetyl esterase/lipase